MKNEFKIKQKKKRNGQVNSVKYLIIRKKAEHSNYLD